MKFETLPLKQSIKRVLGELGVEQATEVQAQILPRLLNSPCDLLVQAPAGSGKSFSYLIPIFQRFDTISQSIQAVILVPTPEHAIQINSQIENLAKYEKIRVATICGVAPLQAEMKILTKILPQIIVGIPARIKELVVRKKLLFDRVETLVIDNADQMTVIEDLELIGDHCTFNDKKTWIFSETQTTTEIFLKDPFMVKIGDVQENLMINYHNVEVSLGNREQVLEQLLLDESTAPSFVFCNSRSEVARVNGFLQVKGFQVLPLHDGMELSEKEKNLEQFKKGQVNILVCTDQAVRELEIEELECIYNLGFPEDSNAMISRVERVGRQGRAGKVFNLF